MYKNGFTAMLSKNKISVIKDNTSKLELTVSSCNEPEPSSSPSNVYDKCVPITVGIIPNIRTTLMINTVVKKRF